MANITFAQEVETFFGLDLEDYDDAPEGYFEISAYSDGEEDPAWDGLCYGSLGSIMSSMDCLLDGVVDDTEDCLVCISIDGVDILVMDHPTGPDDYEIIAHEDTFYEYASSLEN